MCDVILRDGYGCNLYVYSICIFVLA
uniref:Uncharacterized protein n=1 Tax=Anguilla anguilla TaxID=7936 RepID=A0A0E9RGD4_ANGAN